VTVAERVRVAGVVGAGGAGFPTHVKLEKHADTVIANGAECEPLLHKDAAVMEQWAAQVVAGVRLTMEAVARRQSVPRWAETTPDHLLFLPEIARTIPGALFGTAGEGFLRLSYGAAAPAVLEETVARIGRYSQPFHQ
jgi:hypothetical protein